MSEYADALMGHVEWTKNRNVLVFRREYDDRVFVRMRVFQQHRQNHFWYPGPRSFQVNQECAGELGEALICAAGDQEYCEPPYWWAEFQEQYERKGKLSPPKWKREAKVHSTAANDPSQGG